MPEQLGAYVLDRRIGAGGMADVFLAHGPNGACVIKRPHSHLCASDEFVRMFLDEASLLAQLHHPGIAQIFDLGQEGGVYYLAMEYVPGFDLMTISLEHERQGEFMAPELAAKVVADAAGALHYAHNAVGADGRPLNLIHRDVSPHNILVSTRGEVKLIDFGVAKAAKTMHRTQAGLVKGKYPYMAPEQVTGQVIDCRVDIYALGLVLYELLTNARAIAGDLEVDQIENARHARIKPVEQLRPNIPHNLRMILSGALQPRVEERYPSAAALQSDLEAYIRSDRHVVGREDLLRLFRIVAAEASHLPQEFEPLPKNPTGSGRHAVHDTAAPIRSVPGDAHHPTDQVPLHPGDPDPITAPEGSQPVLRAAAAGVQLGGAADPNEASADTDQEPALLERVTDHSVPVSLATGTGLPLRLTQLAPGQPTALAMPRGTEPSLPLRPAQLATGQPTAIAVPVRRSAFLGPVLALVVLLLGATGFWFWPAPIQPLVVEPPEIAQLPPVVAVVQPPDPIAQVPPVVAVGQLPDPIAQVPPVVAVGRPPDEIAQPPRDPIAGTRPVGEPAAAPSGLKPEPVRAAVIHVTAVPAMEVVVDKKSWGRTPVDVELAPGKHTVVLQNKELGLSRTTHYKLAGGDKRELSWVAAKGNLLVRVEPFGNIAIGGRVIKKGTSLADEELWEGKYQVAVSNDDLQKTISRQIEVKGGETTELRVNLFTDPP